ncbi:hypothetical protein CSV79_16125 [Sporosarcina sp. P13]|uniref:hypothetical protein n=1 Tax=Sporosarcina sp. P13 TaxID=2048263 RepID=UPI000C171169|nr:hypothetical protein [Sporosarcina sp. P13]PIC62616.1 hypothetical protein CSV79_16125 [Sporosarcina sp. P13]
MSQLQVRSLIDGFNYNYVDSLFDEDQVTNFREWIYYGHHKKINKVLTNEINSKWIIRNYLSSKMILSATVMVTSLEYAIEKNLKMTIPYLSYYAVITCCRSFLYTIPYNEWTSNEDFLKMSHSKIINLTNDYLNHLDSEFASETKAMINGLKEWRELFSYKFPSSGIGLTEEYGLDEVIDTCTTLCELAQLSSEQIQKYVLKKCMHNFEEWGETESNLMEHGYRYNGM